jgi:putative GTP pyrophosphokinase
VVKHWDELLAPYEQAVEELKIKFRGLRAQYEMYNMNSPIEFVTGRVKPIASILDKARTNKIPHNNIEEEIRDIAAVRIMVQFVDDIKPVVEILRTRTDFEIIEERDYIINNKESGYRSYHLVIAYPVQTIYGVKKVFAEIQIRTLAMNFWATIEHSLNYKYKGIFPEEIKTRLQRAAEAAHRLDEEMSNIRDEIQEAHAIFSSKKGDV